MGKFNDALSLAEQYAAPSESSSYKWGDFSLNGQSRQMRKQMLDDVYILNGIALLGQHTVIYAPPNAGKTLTMMSEIGVSIREGNFDPDNLMYVNADDTHKGLTVKLEIAEEAGFHMVAPGHNGFKASYLTGMLADFARQGEAKNKIIVLDTLKKFTDLMDKKKGSEFGDIAREFCSNGGTIISLAHVNKNKNAEGKSIKAGTSDISDDADCVFIVDVISDGDEKVIEFRNDKQRGNVEQSVTFTYDRTKKDYTQLLASFKRIDSDKADSMKADTAAAAFKEDNAGAIQLISGLIYDGVNSQIDIIQNLYEQHSIPKRKSREVLTKLTQKRFNHGALWSYVPRDRNRYEYQLLNRFNEK